MEKRILDSDYTVIHHPSLEGQVSFSLNSVSDYYEGIHVLVNQEELAELIRVLQEMRSELRQEPEAHEGWEDVPEGERYVGRTGEWIRYDKGQLSQLVDPNDEPVAIKFPYEWRLQRRKAGGDE